MKYKFNFTKEDVFYGISSMIFENSSMLGKKTFDNLNKVNFNYKSNGQTFYVKVIDCIENELITMETELKGEEKYLIRYELKGNKYTSLNYTTKLVSDSKLIFWNHLLLSKSIFYFSQKKKFKEMCYYIEEKINEKYNNKN